MCYGRRRAQVLRARLLLLSLLAFAVRALWVALEPATSPIADETMWLTWGIEVLPSPEVAFSPLRLRFVFHPPLYLYFLGVPFAATGSLAAVQYLQCLVGALLVPALGLLGRSAFSEPAGLVAAGLAAFYPELVWFAAHFWAETLFTVLLWWAIERLVASDTRGSALGRGRRGPALRARDPDARDRALLPAVRRAVAGLAPSRRLSPRGARRRSPRFSSCCRGRSATGVVFDAFVPVSTAGALNLWQGNTRLTRQQVYEEYWAVRGRIPKYEHARARALEAILERQPLWIFEKLRSELPEFWAVHAQPIVHLERGAYGIVRRPLALAAVAVVLAPYLAVLVCSWSASRVCRPGARRCCCSRSSSSTCCCTWPLTATRATGSP